MFKKGRAKYVQAINKLYKIKLMTGFIMKAGAMYIEVCERVLTTLIKTEG